MPNFVPMTQLSTLNKHFWKYRWLFFLGIFFVILTNYFRILAPQLTGFVVNTVVQSIKTGPEEVNSGIRDYSNYDVLVLLVIDQFNQQSFKNKIFIMNHFG